MTAVAIIVLAAFAAYHGSFAGAFVYDDRPAIVDNPTIRHLWPPAPWLTGSPERGLPVDGRPLMSLSLALNYAWGGLSVRGYHAFNFVIHVLAGLTLFGLVRRTLDRPALQTRFHANATAIALAVATLWTVHPLQTEAVTYVVQRAESMMALCYLATLYCFVRSMESTAAWRWQTCAVGACLAGMACKEVMVSAPLLVLLYDRTFGAGTFREAWRRRQWLYVGLAATWIPLAGLVARAGSRGGTAGFETPVTWSAYALTQVEAGVRYLGLSFWPHPLVFDYGVALANGPAEVLPAALVLGLLVAATTVGAWRRGAAGFAGVFFLAVLAPTSSIVPIATETMAEHRMYLPLAGVLALLVTGVYSLLGRRSPLVVMALAAGWAALTVRRNETYRSAAALWADTVVKCPDNARAHFNLGELLLETGDTAGAIREDREAVRLKPNFASAHNNLADALFQAGDLAGAMQHAGAAVRINPALAEGHVNLGNVFFRTGRMTEALAQYQQAVRLKPDDATMHRNLGSALSGLNRLADATREYERALQLEPGVAVTHFFLGNTLARMGHVAEASAHYEEALRLRPDYPAARDNLARLHALPAAGPARASPH